MPELPEKNIHNLSKDQFVYEGGELLIKNADLAKLIETELVDAITHRGIEAVDLRVGFIITLGETEPPR